MVAAAWIGRTIWPSTRSAGAHVVVGGAKGAAEQADAADEGRLEADGSIMVGLFRGSAVIVDQGKVVRPSQLIRSVRHLLVMRGRTAPEWLG
jgi:hypothetical protein